MDKATQTAIREGRYKDVPCLVLENEKLRVTVIPEIGSKIASIVFLPLSHEVLWQTTGELYRRSRYGDSYLDGEVSGFDEMFPTIGQCFCESFPWQGIEMPDHGEVWAIPWEARIEDDCVSLCCHGVRFPYRLSKRIRLDAGRIRIDYSVENLSSFCFDYMWAAHPLFAAEEGMQIVVPPGMASIVNSVPTERLGSYGARHSFPCTRLAGGEEFALDSMPSRNSTHFQKYWFQGKVPEGWCILHDRRRSLNIGLQFPKEKVPYLGMFVNEGGFLGQYEIAPEPSTGSMDRLDASRLWGGSSCLGPRAIERWALTIAIEKGTRRPFGMDAAGSFQ